MIWKYQSNSINKLKFSILQQKPIKNECKILNCVKLSRLHCKHSNNFAIKLLRFKVLIKGLLLIFNFTRNKPWFLWKSKILLIHNTKLPNKTLLFKNKVHLYD